MALAALAAVLAFIHLWLAEQALPPRLGESAADRRPRRIEVAFVRELAQATAPAAAAVPRAPQRRTIRPATAASAPESELQPESLPLPSPSPSSSPSLAPVVEAEVLAAVPHLAEAPVPPPASTPDSAADTAASAPQVPAAIAAAPGQASPEAPFDWPPSTRLTYTLSGNYRGPVAGKATVEWLRSGSRYQVFMDVAVGPPFAPLISRRVSSEGEITAEGLLPRRYDEETRALLRAPRRQTIWLDADRVRLPNGRELPRPPGVQDSASQFVQLTWLFTTQPQSLQPGRSFELPLALPRQVEPWIYDVVGIETLATPAGPVPAMHVKPRREARPGGDLAAEMWVAPSLQYLPVRIVIRQDAETYIDLLIERLPEQAASGR